MAEAGAQSEEKFMDFQPQVNFHYYDQNMELFFCQAQPEHPVNPHSLPLFPIPIHAAEL
jgi:hypothetical protein